VLNGPGYFDLIKAHSKSLRLISEKSPDVGKPEGDFGEITRREKPEVDFGEITRRGKA
jgi:hypothetical protein